MSINIIPGMQRSTKQFCWVYKNLSSRTLLCLVLATFFQCKSETPFWLKTISVPNIVKHCLPFATFFEFNCFNSCLNFFGWKILLSSRVNKTWIAMQLWISFSKEISFSNSDDISKSSNHIPPSSTFQSLKFRSFFRAEKLLNN